MAKAQRQQRDQPTRQELAVVHDTRLPLPTNYELGDDIRAQWRVLVESVFPGAQTVGAVVMAVEYCKHRKLDVMKRPVNIVQMWSTKLDRYVETVWPGINEIETTAHRTASFAGIDTAKLGPMTKKTFRGKKKVWPDPNNNRWEMQSVEYEVTFPEWGEVTVYRMVQGVRCPFTERVYWLEAYGREGGKDSETPNPMWRKRPVGQFTKVCKAFSLRVAFPEETGYSAEEMEGHTIENVSHLVDPASITPKAGPNVIKVDADEAQAEEIVEEAEIVEETPAEPAPASPLEPHAIPLQKVGSNPNYMAWSVAFAEKVRLCESVDALKAWNELNMATLEHLEIEAPKLFENVLGKYKEQKRKLSGEPPEEKKPPAKKAATAPADRSPQAFFAWFDENSVKHDDRASLETWWNDYVAPRLEELPKEDQQEATMRFNKRKKYLQNRWK